MPLHKVDIILFIRPLVQETLELERVILLHLPDPQDVVHASRAAQGAIEVEFDELYCFCVPFQFADFLALVLLLLFLDFSIFLFFRGRFLFSWFDSPDEALIVFVSA